MAFPKIFKNKQKKVDSDKTKPPVSKIPQYVVTLDKNNFNPIIEKYPLSLVDFWAPWCSPCKTMAPRLRRLSKIYRGKIAFGKLNTQDYKEIANKNKVTGIPHFAFFSYGKNIGNITGIKSLSDFKDTIETIIKKNQI